MYSGRVLFLADTFSHAPSGELQALSSLLQALANEGFEMTLITFDPPGSPAIYPLPNEVQWMQIAGISKNVLPHSIAHPSLLSELKRNFSRIICLRKVLSNVPSGSIVVGTGTYRGVICYLASWHLNLNIVCWEHTHPSTIGPIWRFLRNISFRSPRVKAIVTVSHESALAQSKLFGKKVGCIYNLIRPSDSIYQLNERPPLEQKSILSVGRLFPVKGFSVLLEAFAQIIPKHPTARLTIVGDGPLQLDLIRLANSLEINSSVNFAGRQSDPTTFYNNHAVYVCASRAEGFGLALIEAMQNGMAVISSNYEYGSKEIIEDGRNGLLFKVDDPKDLANKLDLLLSRIDLQKQLARAAKMIDQKFSNVEQISKWKHLFRNLT